MMVLRKRVVRANFDIDLRFYYIFLKIYLKYILRDKSLLCFLPSAEREMGAYCFRPASGSDCSPVTKICTPTSFILNGISSKHYTIDYNVMKIWIPLWQFDRNIFE